MALAAQRRSANKAGLNPRWALVLSLFFGAVAAAGVWRYYQGDALLWSDFDQVWLGGRALLAGHDPYVEVPKSFPWPLYYPLPALLLGMPLSLFPVAFARAIFAALSAGLVAWAIFRHRPQAWPLLLSAPFAYALRRGQWEPLLVAGALIPRLGWIMAAKPSIGLATFAWRPTRAVFVGAAALGLVSLVIEPSWPAEWLASLRHVIFKIVPALMPGGIILLASFGRWRRADARLLGALACIPQSPAAYSLLPLALIPTTVRQALGIWLSWGVLYFVTHRGSPLGPITAAQVTTTGNNFYWPMHLVLGYFPALLAVLTPSPLRELPKDFGRWSPQRQRTYRVLWSAVLGIVSLIALLFTVLIWRGA